MTTMQELALYYGDPETFEQQRNAPPPNAKYFRCGTWYDPSEFSRCEHIRAETDRHKCIVDGCQHRRIGRGLCGMHYDRWRKTGDPLRTPTGKVLQHGPRPCIICGDPVVARDMCNRHYSRLRKYGDPHFCMDRETVVARQRAGQLAAFAARRSREIRSI